MDDPTNAPFPPWLMYPEWPAGHIAWRMGAGEDHVGAWTQWVRGLTSGARQEYILGLCPIPDDWMLLTAELYAASDDESSVDAAYEALRMDIGP